MPCLPLLLILFFPRVLLVLIAVFTNWFHSAFDTLLWPILGFFFMPYTTLAYMGAMLMNNHAISGGWWIVIIIAALVDLSHLHLFRRRKRR